MRPAAPPPENAVWQAGRRARAPDPSAFQLDARSPADLLRWASGFAGQLTYFAEDGRRLAPEGKDAPWRAFLDGDVVFLLAEICTRDAAQDREHDRLPRFSRRGPLRRDPGQRPDF